MSDSDGLARISRAGVSVWLDDLSRESIASGDLASLISDQHVVGVTTNPTIFAKAVAGGSAYDSQLAQLAAAGADVDEAVIELTTSDVRAAADLFAPTFAATDGQDGRVSIEVDPRLARDTEATIAAARMLWEKVDRPNVMIKIPATVEGLPAITASIAAGISVNVTLIFSLDRYRGVVAAYLDGLEQALEAGIDLAGIRSVASVFLSRIDTKMDAALEEIGSPDALALRGSAAVANARVTYAMFEELFASERFTRLAQAGAHRQRPLWASTGTKNPAYRDTMYVDDLVVADVVSTMPRATLAAVADHGGDGSDQVHGREEAAQQVLDDLRGLGVDVCGVMNTLEEEGVASFDTSWAELLQTVQAGLGR